LRPLADKLLRALTVLFGGPVADLLEYHKCFVEALFDSVYPNTDNFSIRNFRSKGFVLCIARQDGVHFG
jgi:hypothetical protein